MHELVKLVNQWAAFHEKYPDGRMEDFCRYVLSQSGVHAKSSKGPAKKGPMDTDSRFMRAITRTTMSYWIYLRIALKDTEIKTQENFNFMSSLLIQGEVRKTDVINHAMIEFTTGIEILNRLIKSGMVQERVDDRDKRSHLLSLTARGKKSLQYCFKKTLLARDILLHEVREEDKEVCVLILEQIYNRHAALAMESKAKTIEEIHEGVVTVAK